MLRERKNSRGQSIAEYVLVFGVVLAAIYGMSVYMRRGIQGTIKTVADEIGGQSDAEDIDPQRGAKSQTLMDTYSYAAHTTNINLGGGITTNFSSNTTSSGTATYVANSEER
jgi:hypothetical protein